AQETLSAGADLVCFSGDKLLGGPQAGIVVGRAELVERLRRHPLQRALRADKLTLAALEGTLGLYLEPERAVREIPVLRMLTEPSEAVRARAERLAALTAGPRPVGELARERGADGDTLHRFLRALASDGVFAEEEPGVFRNTPASELLRTGWGAFAHLFGGVFHRTAAGLEADGKPVFPSMFGVDFWSWLAEHPDERAAFDTAMEQGKEQRIGRLAELEWRGDETVVDVGGGNGSFLIELIRSQPGLRGIVYDLPETV